MRFEGVLTWIGVRLPNEGVTAQIGVIECEIRGAERGRQGKNREKEKETTIPGVRE